MFDLLMIVVFVSCAVQFWRGKWLWLIAGYNTTSHQEKEKVNASALGKAMSGLLIISAALIGLMRVFPKLQLVGVIGIVILVGVMIAYINISPRFKQ
ncbi:DUF3784 domain-containing protein [Candidatus Enterococcus mansonii]|uniref:DUF3784 domain-containing protein n=1 Tax=Candidatus Enterococcus mansonii TaxID=1834181 RepID=A0A242CIB0_9ENTE|nr:DUF3784 domain-containing protein [Enterococcus sp. 4G2_DIV0659]OTO09899.1 hypothetical protein A5880_000582 [Enterococcus sp. 4G2_DIV0659]